MQVYRAAIDLRSYPTVWRVRLLLTSRVWDKEKDMRLWENENGEIVGLAFLWRRWPTSPYVVLEQIIHPILVTRRLATSMLRWGCLRTQELVNTQQSPLPVYTTGFAPFIFQDKHLIDAGFQPIPDNPDEHNVYLERSLQEQLPPLSPPPGIEVRPLQGWEEVDTYRAVFDFASVSDQHLKEQIESDEYQQIVVVNAQGEFAAYCECSICRQEWDATGERLGWIDYVETHPRHQRQGLGYSALLAGMAQLQAWGAQQIMLTTISSNFPALSLYNKAGFKTVEVHHAHGYQKEIPTNKVIL